MPKKTFFKLPAEKQRKILDAAAEEFIEYRDNYKKSSVNRIAERAEIAVGSIYKYFYDKNDLFIHVFNCHKDVPRTADGIDTFYAYSREEISLEERLTPVGEILIGIIVDNEDLFHDLVFGKHAGKEYFEGIGAYLERDRERGFLRRGISAEIASYMYASLEYAAYQYCLQHDIDFRQDTEVLRQITELFFFGLYRDGAEEEVKG